MRKILLSCVAFSLIVAVNATAQEITPKEASLTENQNKAVASEQSLNKTIEKTNTASEKQQAKSDSTDPKNTEKKPENAPKENKDDKKNIQEEQLKTSENTALIQAELEKSFQSFLSEGGFKSDNPLVFEQRGADYIVTIPELKIPLADGHKVLPQQTVTLIRNGDFAGQPQFQIKMDFLTKIQSILKLLSDDMSVDADRYVQDMQWVPRLELISNNSVQAENLTLSLPEHLTVTIKSMVSDLLIQPTEKSGKMDVAAATDSYDTVISTPFGQVNLPRISYHNTQVDSEITGDEALQMLTATRSSSTLEIPQFTATSLLMPDQKLSGMFASSVQLLPSQAKLSLKVGELKTTQKISDLLPEEIIINVTFDNLKNEDMIHVWHTQRQIQTLVDNNQEIPDELENQFESRLKKIFDTMTVRISEVSAFNSQAGVKFAGVLTHLGTKPEIDLTLSVTNFDFISPKPKKIDTEKCTTLVQQVSENQNDTKLIQEMQEQCMPKTGILEDLRPYLSSASHTKNEAGQPVDTFFISFQNNQLTINGQAVENTDLPIGVLKSTDVSDRMVSEADQAKQSEQPEEKKSDESETNDSSDPKQDVSAKNPKTDSEPSEKVSDKSDDSKKK